MAELNIKQLNKTYNGEIVLKNGTHTGKFPGRFVKGIGKDL